jgi:hypothetical protein
MAYNKETAKKWRERNKELLSRRNKEYREKNHEHYLARKVKYRELNREKVADYDRIYRQTHKKERVKWASAYHKARRASEGSHTEQEWQELKEKYHNRCVCCLKQEPEVKLTRDHVIPFRQSGTSYIVNIQPLCASCNSRKKTSTTDFRFSFQRK